MRPARRFSDPADLEVDPRRRSLGSGVAALLGVVVFVLTGLPVLKFGARTQLVMPIGPDLQTAAIFVGAFAGALVAGAIGLARRTWPTLTGSALCDGLAAFFLCVLTATWGARGVVEEYAFAGLSPASAPAAFTVVDALTVGRGEEEPLVRLRYGADGRRIEVKLADGAYRAARPGQVVWLPVQTGRGGVRRVLIPARRLTPADLRQP